MWRDLDLGTKKKKKHFLVFIDQVVTPNLPTDNKPSNNNRGRGWNRGRGNYRGFRGGKGVPGMSPGPRMMNVRKRLYIKFRAITDNCCHFFEHNLVY